MRSSLFNLFVTGAFLAAASTFGQENLAQNADFNQNLDGWSQLSFGQILWDSEDALGNADSGSAVILIQDNDSYGAVLQQCVPVIPGAPYSFSAWGMVPADQPPFADGDVAQIVAAWFTTPDCSGDYFGPFRNIPIDGAWHRMDFGQIIAPNDAQSVVLEGFLSGSGPDIERRAHFDRFELKGPRAIHCLPTPTTHCLQNGHFSVTVEWTDFDGNSGPGRRVEDAVSPDSGLFWFFSPNNWELMIKILDGCSINNHFWVFAAATTNVAYTLQVTDLQTGLTEEYTNPLGQASPAITDTSAFATCP